MSLRSKLIDLFKTDFKSFSKLVNSLYETEGEGLIDTLVSKYNNQKVYFVIDGEIIGFETLLLNIENMARQARILRNFKLL